MSDPTPPAQPGDLQTRHSKEAKSRRTLWLVLLAAVLVVVGGLVAYFVSRGDTPTAQPNVTITMPAPTLTLSPIAKPEGTAFFNALPATVGTYALTQIDAAAGSPAAIEAYQLVYSDGTNTVTLLAAQYPDAATAEATVAGLATGANAAPEPVKAGAETVGSMVSVPGTGGANSVIWNNKTAVFQVSGPKDAPSEFFRAMPL